MALRSATASDPGVSGDAGAQNLGLPEQLVRGGESFFNSPPSWYQPASFQYNVRCVLGLLPGALMLGVVTGQTFVAVLVLCVLAVLITHSLGYDVVSLVLTLASGFVCQMTNAYCMFPLILHSILNLPLLAMFHVLIPITVGWCILQHTEGLKKQDGRLAILVEKLLFMSLPALVIVMATWVSGMVIGREALPVAAALSGITCVTLYLVPLESSYAKPGTPFDHSIIQYWFVVVVYQVVIAVLPGILYAALHHLHLADSLQHVMQFQLAIASPIFFLTLLEAQQVFYWLGITSTPVRLVRWISGAVVLGSLSALALLSHSSTLLPALLVPIMFVILSLVTTLDMDKEQTTPQATLTTWVFAGVAEILCIAAGFTLPWGVSYNFSVLSLPLSLLQLAMLLLAMASILLLLGWRRDLSLLWPTYHAVCVGCEMVLTREGFYPLTLLLCTASAAVLLCVRLYLVGQVPLPHTILCLCIHVLKLSHLLPAPSLSSPSTIMSNAGLILAGVAVVRTNTLAIPIKLKHLLFYTGMFAVGVSLSAPFVISHTLTLISHTPPSSANLAMMVCASVGVFMLQYQPLLSPSGGKTAISYLPLTLLLLASLFYLLQPEFIPMEVLKALGVLVLHHLADFGTDWRIENALQIMAWDIILTWAVVLSAIAFSVIGTFRNLLPSVFLHLTALIGGCFTGLLAGLRLMHKQPFTIPSMLYGIAGAAAAAIISISLVNGGQRQYHRIVVLLLSALFVLLIGTGGLSLVVEKNALPEHIMTDSSTSSLPCTLVYSAVFLSVAAALKTVSLRLGHPFLPLVCNMSCLVMFLFSLALPLGLDEAVVISLASCVMLLSQPDGLVIPHSSGLFLAPTLALSSLTLYAISFSTTLSQLTQLSLSTQLELTVRVMELLLLIAAIPGQVVLIRCLWTGRPFSFTLPLLLLYLLPNGLLPKFGQGSYNTVLGSSAILAFCLLSLTDISVRRV